MTETRKTELTRKAMEIVAQEARHLADTADYDQVAVNDEEDDFLRQALRNTADNLEALARFKQPRTQYRGRPT